MQAAIILLALYLVATGLGPDGSFADVLGGTLAALSTFIDTPPTPQ